jgi:hypothetical protein
VPADDPVIQKLAKEIRGGTREPIRTYDIALAILFLDKLGDPQDRPLIQNLGLRLVAGQMTTGGWGYDVPSLAADQERQLLTALEQLQPKSDKELAALLADPTLGNPPGNPAPGNVQFNPVGFNLDRIPAVNPRLLENAFKGSDSSDNSNTQFAILGLWAARRHGVPVDRALVLVAHRFYRSQQGDGGWGYPYGTGPGQFSSATMTCAGLLGLAVGHTLASPQDQKTPKENPRINKGLARLGQALKGGGGELNLTRNLYFLWSVERVGVLFNLNTISGVDWYEWSVDGLLPTQTPQGYWNLLGYVGSVDHIDTCFALLVLRRADLAKDLSRKLEMLIEIKDLK